MNNYQIKENKKINNSGLRAKRAAGFSALAESLLADLSSRSKEIVEKRFGLNGETGETLERIGLYFGVTRERVRQIISEALRNVAKKADSEEYLRAEEKIIFTIKDKNGIIKEGCIVDELNADGPDEANAIKFFAGCSAKVFEVEDKGVLEKAWVVSKEKVGEVKKILLAAEKILKADKKLLTDLELFDELKGQFGFLAKDQVLNYLAVSARIKKNKFGKWGLSDWMEVNPKGTREKVYLILKEEKKPLHFTEIAGLIDKYRLGKRKAHPQTVHNELIKDDRFILIGRGIYALKEWGYFEGTIREVLERILKNSAKPLSKEEIVNEVMKIRKVKKTTVMINLNNAKVFKKQKDLYQLRNTK